MSEPLVLLLGGLIVLAALVVVAGWSERADKRTEHPDDPIRWHENDPNTEAAAGLGMAIPQSFFDELQRLAEKTKRNP